MQCLEVQPAKQVPDMTTVTCIIKFFNYLVIYLGVLLFFGGGTFLLFFILNRKSRV